MSKQTMRQIGLLIVLVLVGAGVLWNVKSLPEQGDIVNESNELGNLVDQESPTVRSAAELRERYVEEGYPAADQISVELADEFWNAFVEKKLYTIDEVSDGYFPQTIYLVSVADPDEVNYEYCGLYSPGLCLAIYERGDEHRILQTFVGMRGAPMESTLMGHVEFEEFFPDLETLFIKTSIGDGPGGEQDWWAMNIETGEMQKVVTMNFGYDGDNGETRYTLTHATSGDEVNVVVGSAEGLDEQGGTTEITYNHLTMSDAEGVLKDQALDLPPDAYPTLVVDAQGSMSGVITFMFRFEENTEDRGKQIYEWTNYIYDPSATLRLTEQQIP